MNYVATRVITVLIFCDQQLPCGSVMCCRSESEAGLHDDRNRIKEIKGGQKSKVKSFSDALLSPYRLTGFAFYFLSPAVLSNEVL